MLHETNPEAAALKRIFALLYMLRDEYSFSVKNKKLYKDYTAKANSQHFNEINGQILRMFRLGGGQKYAQIIAREMTDDRIKDLHSFLDVILEVENIEIITQVIKAGLQEKQLTT